MAASYDSHGAPNHGGHSNGAHNGAHHISAGNYLVGFFLAVVLTLFSFIPVMYNWLDGWTISAKVIYLLGFALIQIAVQVVYFLHLNEGPDAKWNVGTMWFAALCVLIIIGGTWWAIQHLNYNMMGGSGRIIIPAMMQSDMPQEPSNAMPSEEPEAAPEQPGHEGYEGPEGYERGAVTAPSAAEEQSEAVSQEPAPQKSVAPEDNSTPVTDADINPAVNSNGHAASGDEGAKTHPSEQQSEEQSAN